MFVNNTKKKKEREETIIIKNEKKEKQKTNSAPKFIIIIINKYFLQLKRSFSSGSFPAWDSPFNEPSPLPCPASNPLSSAKSDPKNEKEKRISRVRRLAPWKTDRGGACTPGVAAFHTNFQANRNRLTRIFLFIVIRQWSNQGILGNEPESTAKLFWVFPRNLMAHHNGPEWEKEKLFTAAF